MPKRSSRSSSARGHARAARHAAETLVAESRAWIVRARYKAFAYTAAIAVAAVATITFIGAPWLPVVGVAVAALAVSVSNVTKNLAKPTCLSCGKDLVHEPIGVHGVICPGCGAVNSGTLVNLAKFNSREHASSKHGSSKHASAKHGSSGQAPRAQG